MELSVIEMDVPVCYEIHRNITRRCGHPVACLYGNSAWAPDEEGRLQLFCNGLKVSGWDGAVSPVVGQPCDFWQALPLGLVGGRLR